MIARDEATDTAARASDSISRIGLWLIKHADELAADLKTETILEGGFTVTADVTAHGISTVKVAKEYVVPRW